MIRVPACFSDQAHHPLHYLFALSSHHPHCSLRGLSIPPSIPLFISHHSFPLSSKIKLWSESNQSPNMVSFVLCYIHISNSAWHYECLVVSVQFSSVAQSCLTLCDPMDCSMPGLPVHHQLLEFTQTHVHWVGDAIQPSHPLLAPSPSALNLSQHQGLFKCVSSAHQVAKLLEFQLQHQSYQWTPRTDLL